MINYEKNLIVNVSIIMQIQFNTAMTCFGYIMMYDRAVQDNG